MYQFKKPYHLAIAIFALVLVYIATGLLGMKLAIPPGYATVFWPPSGFAMAAVYIYGYRMGLGVFWGAFLTNIIASMSISNPDLMTVAYINAVFIALGSTAQACASTYLVKKFIGNDSKLETFSEIFKFSVLAGPIGCCVAASIGVTTLVLSETIPVPSFIYTWANWFVGDSLGVLVFSPLLVILFSHGISLKRKLLTSLPMVLIFSLVIVSFFFIRQVDQETKIKKFQFDTALIKEELDYKLNEHFYILRSMQALYHSSNIVEAAEFDLFALNTINQEKLMGGIGFAPLVIQDELESFVDRVDREKIKYFALKNFGKEHDRICSPFCTPLLHAYPMKVRQNVSGLDLSKHPVRLNVIKKAINSGTLNVSENVMLSASLNKGFISVLPVFRDGVIVPRDMESIEGFIVGATSYKLLFDDTFFNWQDLGIQLKLYDETDKKVLVYSVLDEEPKTSDQLAKSKNPFVFSYKENIAGRTWRFEFYIDEQFALANVNWNIWFALAASLFFTFFASVFLCAITGQTAAVENIVVRKTKELKESNKFMNIIMDSVPDLIFVKNKFSQIVQCNKGFKNLYKPEYRDGIIGRTGFENFPEEEVKGFKVKDTEAFENGYSETFETVTNFENETRDYFMRKIAFEIESGNKYLLAIGRDVTQEQETLDRLQKSEERFRTSIENAPIGMSLVDMDQNWILYNQALSDMLGYKYKEFADTNLKELTHPDDVKKDTTQIKQLLAGDIDKYSVEKRYLKNDGVYIWVLLTLAVVRDDDHEPLYYVAHALDITERKKANEVQAQLAKIVDSAVTELYIFDQDTLKFLDANKAALSNLGYTQKQLFKKTPVDIKPNMNKEDFLEKIKPVRTGKVPNLKFDTSHQRKDGSHYDVLVNLQTIDYQDRKAFMAIVLDITDRKTIENDLKRSNQELEEFAYVASHDLKAPLRHVALSADYLSHEYKDKLDDKALEFLGIMTKSTRRMQDMIESLLEYSRVGRLRAENIECLDFNEIVEQTLETLSPAIKEHKAKVTVSEMPDNIMGNKTLFVQLFQNLLQNALKYRKEDVNPTIKVEAKIDKRFAVISVSDNGIGIDPEYADKVFQVFKRLHHNEEKYEGTGIGLAICQRIVEFHDGEIWLDKKYSKGCKFVFKLPIS